jgi:hypothetical protein
VCNQSIFLFFLYRIVLILGKNQVDFLSKKKFKNIMVFEKNEKKFFFRKTGLPAKPKYPEISETFFFLILSLKLNSLQAYIKKIKKLICCIRLVPKLIKKIFFTITLNDDFLFLLQP